MNIGELNQKLHFVIFRCVDETIVSKELLQEAKTYIEEDRKLDGKIGYPGELSVMEHRQREEDYAVLSQLLESFDSLPKTETKELTEW